MFLPDELAKCDSAHSGPATDCGPVNSKSVPLLGLDTLKREVRGVMLLFFSWWRPMCCSRQELLAAQTALLIPFSSPGQSRGEANAVHLVRAVTSVNRHWGGNVRISSRDNAIPTHQKPNRYVTQVLGNSALKTFLDTRFLF